MATGIRPGKFRPRSTSTMNITSSPSVQNVVTPKSAVTTYNPAAGAGVVGQQIASRMEAMGKNISDFWNLQSRNLNTIAEVETRNRLVEIENENLAQRRQAIVDHAKDPSMSRSLIPPELKNDLDYMETRLSLRPNTMALEDASSWVIDKLPQLDLVNELG